MGPLSSADIARNRDTFLVALRAVLLRMVEAHPEKFKVDNSPEAVKAGADASNVSVEVYLAEVAVPKLSSVYTGLLALRQVFYLDEVLWEACIHVGIEPSLEVLFEHIGAMSEADSNNDAKLLQGLMKTVNANLDDAIARAGLKNTLRKGPSTTTTTGSIEKTPL